MHFNIRDDRLCTLVITGARSNGEKELLAAEDRFEIEEPTDTQITKTTRRPPRNE